MEKDLTASLSGHLQCLYGRSDIDPASIGERIQEGHAVGMESWLCSPALHQKDLEADKNGNRRFEATFRPSGPATQSLISAEPAL